MWKLKEGNMGIVIREENVEERLRMREGGYVVFEGKMVFEGRGEEVGENKIVGEKYLSKSFVVGGKEFMG